LPLLRKRSGGGLMARCPWPVVMVGGVRYRRAPDGCKYLDDVDVEPMAGGFRVMSGSGWGSVGFGLSRARAAKLMRLLIRYGVKV